MPFMRRTVSIVRAFWSTSLAAEREYRGNFVVAALTSLGNLGGALFSIWLFYRQGAGFVGWSVPEVTIVLGLFSIWTGVVAALLTPNLSRIVTHVTEGTLEFVLLRPVDPQLQVSLRVLSPWGITDVVLGIVLVVVGLAGSERALGASSLWAIVPMISAAVLLYSLWFLLATTAIWFTKIYNATEVLRGLMDAGRFPISAYPLAYRFVFTWIVPVAFVTTVPAEALLGRSNFAWLFGSVALAAGSFFACRRFWLRALRSYTGASG
jgi:ABC-2 type transport system permease protein